MYRKKPPRANWRLPRSNWTFPASRPLLQELYQATRETEEQAVLERLAHIKTLVEGGADLKATDPQGRTALHWAIFGSSYHVKPNILVAYEEIADALIQRGVEINRQDVYQDTALDYLLYSPSFVPGGPAPGCEHHRRCHRQRWKNVGSGVGDDEHAVRRERNTGADSAAVAEN